MLASVLEPEHHVKLKKLVEDQKHQSFSRPPSSSKGTSSAAPTPSKPAVDEREDVGTIDDDGVMSGCTQATAQLWSTAVAAPPLDHSDTHSVASHIDERALHTMSIDELMSIQLLLQREMERRARSASASLGTSPLMPIPPMGSASSTPIPAAPRMALAANIASTNFVDQQAVDSRKGLKRSKSGGNESAFNPRSRTPQPKVTGTPTTPSHQNGRLDLNAVEREDPELLSVHSDVLNTTSGSAGLSGHSLGAVMAAVTSSSGATSSTGGRPVSRTNGALHPNDKMLYGHRNTALPCLSPMDPPAQSSPLMDMAINSRSSSRPPSRGVTLANFEDRLSASLGGSQSLGGHNFTAESLSLVSETIMPIEAVNISNAQMTLDQYITANRPSQSMSREVSRGELVLSPHCAFDDISLGSQSVNSSISSRQQRRPRRRDTQTSTSTITTINTTGSSSMHHHHHPGHR